MIGSNQFKQQQQQQQQ